MSKESWPIFRQTPNNSGKWNNLKFYLNDTSHRAFDFWVVYEDLGSEEEKTICDIRNTIFVTGEPYRNKKYSQKFLNQFGIVITSQDEITHNNKLISQEGQPWFVSKDYDFLTHLSDVDKSEEICLILSNKCSQNEHYKRLKFALDLKKHFKDRLHWFGRGIRNFEDKWDTISKYKYSIVFESCIANNYISEKIHDCFLSYTFPFYSGSNDIFDYYNQGLKLIDIDSLDKTITEIEQIINNPIHYSSTLSSLSYNRSMYLTHHQLFPLIEKSLKKVSKSKRNNDRVQSEVVLRSYNKRSLINPIMNIFNSSRENKLKKEVMSFINDNKSD